jgi:drug/metabolite transporter (DMT)-like permease
MTHSSSHSQDRSAHIKLWINLGLVYVIWGSTYAGIAIVGQTVDPLLGVGTRFVAAGTLLAIFLKFRGVSLRVTRAEFLSTALIGFLLLTLGVGLLSMGELVVPTGVASLLICGTALWVALFRTLSGDRPSRRTLLGVIIGLAGMVVLVVPGNAAIAGADSALVLPWTLAILVGSLAWSFGSFISQRLQLPKNLLVMSAWEMLIGGAILLIVGFALGERIRFEEISAASWWAWVYLVLAGSLVGYLAYIWLLGNAPISLVATYSYINPVVAVALGVVLLKESITANMMFGGLIVLAGVILTITAETPTQSAAQDSSTE